MSCRDYHETQDLVKGVVGLILGIILLCLYYCGKDERDAKERADRATAIAAHHPGPARFAAPSKAAFLTERLFLFKREFKTVFQSGCR